MFLLDPQGHQVVLTTKTSSSPRKWWVHDSLAVQEGRKESGFAILSCLETNSPKLTPPPAEHSKPRLHGLHNSMFQWGLKGGEGGGWFYVLRAGHLCRIAWVPGKGTKHQSLVPRCGITRSFVLMVGSDLCSWDWEPERLCTVGNFPILFVCIKPGREIVE